MLWFSRCIWWLCADRVGLFPELSCVTMRECVERAGVRSGQVYSCEYSNVASAVVVVMVSPRLLRNLFS
jgi:hypothetical protein